MKNYSLTGRAIAFYMSFFRRQGWQVQFLEADLNTPPPGACKKMAEVTIQFNLS
jgi:hypothetical protein